MIIGNDCLAAFIYKKLNMKFDNPFMYSTIIDTEYYKLVYSFNSLNLYNYTYYTLSESKNDYSHISLISKLGPQNLYCFLIDNTVEIAFLHHVQSDYFTEKTKVGSEVYYNNVINILINNYENRLRRMNGDIKFIYNEKKTMNPCINNLITDNKLFVLFTIRDIQNTDTMRVIRKFTSTEKIRNLVNRTNFDFIV